MVKIFPVRFLVDNEVDTEQLWKWINQIVKNTKVTQVIPINIESHKSKDSILIKGLIEVHCTENILTREFESLLKPCPSFVKEAFFTYQ